VSASDRREREKEQRRAQILDAARRILFAEGLTGASMNKIALSAELSVGTLYVYFQNKEDLFAALQEEGLNLLYAMIRRAASGQTPPEEKLRRIARAYLRFSRRHRKYFDIYNYFLSSPEVSFPDDLKRRIDRHGERIVSLAAGVMSDYAPGGQAGRDPRRCALVFWSTLHGLLQFRKLRDTILADENYDELYEYAVTCLLKSFSTDACFP